MDPSNLMHDGDCRQLSPGEAGKLSRAGIAEWNALFNCWLIVDGKGWSDVEAVLDGKAVA